MKKSHKTRKGYTLAELILVVTLIVFLFMVGLNGMIRTQESYKFNETVQDVLTMIRKARSYAVTGRAMPDYHDYDQDGCKLNDADAASMTDRPTNAYNTGYRHNTSATATIPVCANLSETDYVVPANYGVFIYNCRYNQNQSCAIYLFADLAASSYEDYFYFNPAMVTRENYKVSVYYDVYLEKLVLPKNIFITNLRDLPLGVSNYNYFGIFYSPIFADVKLSRNLNYTTAPYPAPSMKFRIQEGPDFYPKGRQRCFQIHKVSGNPEEIPCS